MLLGRDLDLAEQRIFFAPDAGAPGAGSAIADDPDAEPDDDKDEGRKEKKYSDEDMEAAVKQRVRKLNRESAAATKKVEELEAKLKELEQKKDEAKDELNNPPSPPSAGGDPSDELRKHLGHWEVQKTKYESQIRDLSSKLEQHEKDLQLQIEQRQNMERDLEIDKALSAVGCIDIENARILIRDRVKYDETDGWYFQTRSGNLLDVKEGVEAELPDYLRPAGLRQGGSGTTGGSPRLKAEQKRLDELKDEHERLKKALNKDPHNNHLLAQMSKTRRAVLELEAKVKARS